jgi:sugar transferase (PEP-CTERM system associated)
MQYYLLNPYLQRVISAVLGDALCLGAASALTWFALAPAFPPLLYAGTAAALAVACFVVLYYCDAYSPHVMGSGRETLACVANAMGLGLLAALVLYFAVPTPPGVVECLANVAALYFPFLLGERLLFRLISAMPRFSQRVVVIGASELGTAIARMIHERRNLGTELVGFLSDDPHQRGEMIEGVPVIGKVHEIEKVVDALKIGRIVVASKSRSEYFPSEELLAAKLRGHRIESGVAFFERITGRIYLRELRPSYLIFADGFQIGIVSEAMKRLIDIAVSAVALVLAAPLLGLCAMAIKLDSKGPVVYRQERLGRNGRTFLVCKLRSMRHMAEKETGPVWAQREDDRITRVGRLLRKARLDEVPQLWNVLIGDMSLVGPRPERPEFIEQLSERYPYFRVRSALKPGVTGWAQIRHGYVDEIEGFEEKLALDLYYMKWRSLLMDLLIMWHTIKTVILFRGQ